MVVGKVLSMVRHPNSDHMWICQVDVGGRCSRADRHRRTERPRGRSGSRGTAQLMAPRRRSHHQGQAPGRTVQRYALLLRRAGSDPERPARRRSPTASGSSTTRTARLARTSTSSSATTTPLWILRSPTTAPTATASSALPGKLPPPSASPCVTTSLWFTAPTPADIYDHAGRGRPRNEAVQPLHLPDGCAT